MPRPRPEPAAAAAPRALWSDAPAAWLLGALLAVLTPAAAAEQPASAPLPAELRHWVQAHQPRLGVERDYGPFVYQAADGSLQGLSIELLQRVQQRTGLRLQVQAPAPLHALLDAARARRVDLLTSLRPSPERSAFLRFSRPYVSVPAVLVLPAGRPLQPLSALAGRPVAVGQGYAVEAPMRQRHPGVDWQAVPDDAQALRGVAEGRYAAAVVDLASAGHLLRSSLQAQASALRVGEQVGFDYALSFAVRADWPELVAVLDAGILALGEAERQALVDRWLPADAGVGRPTHAPRATALALALLALAALGAWWVRRRRPAADRPADPAGEA